MKDIILQSDRIKAHVNAFGAELKGLEMDGVEYLYSGDPEYYGRTSPTLFPITGRFLSDTYFVDDQVWKMPMNGFATNRNFKVHEIGEDYVVLCCGMTNAHTRCIRSPLHFLWSTG